LQNSQVPANEERPDFNFQAQSAHPQAWANVRRAASFGSSLPVPSLPAPASNIAQGPKIRRQPTSAQIAPKENRFLQRRMNSADPAPDTGFG
jgi:hypothetical protein